MIVGVGIDCPPAARPGIARALRNLSATLTQTSAIIAGLANIATQVPLEGVVPKHAKLPPFRGLGPQIVGHAVSL